MPELKKILCVDFDGVLHSYTSGWQGATEIPDEPVYGAIPWLIAMLENANYEIHIYSSRSKEPGGIEAMRDWVHHQVKEYQYPDYLIDKVVERVQYPTQKPPAYLTIDDRAICFRGTFPSILEMDNFKPWYK